MSVVMHVQWPVMCTALLEVVGAGLGVESTSEEAIQYLLQLEEQQRYQKDVWIT